MKIKEARDLDIDGKVIESPGGTKKHFNLIHKAAPYYGNTATNKVAEEKEKNFKDKMEKYVWSCVPDKNIYQRDTTQSKYLTNVNAKKAEKYEQNIPDFIKKLINRENLETES